MTVATTGSPLMKPLINHAGYDIETETFGDGFRVGFSDGSQQGTGREGDQNGGNLLNAKIQGLWTDSRDDTLLFDWDVRNEKNYQGALARLRVDGPGISRVFDQADADFITDGDSLSHWVWQITAPELFLDEEVYIFSVDLTKNKTGRD